MTDDTVLQQTTRWAGWLGGLLLVLLPLPRHWVIVEQVYPGVNPILTSLIVTLADGVIVLLGVLTAVSLPTPSSANRPPSVRLFLALVVMLVTLTAISPVWALDSVLAAQHTLRLLIATLMLVSIVRLRPPASAYRWGVWVALGVQGGTAVLQFLRQDDLGLRWLGEMNLNRYPGGGSIITVGETYWLRGYGLTPHPNILGGVLALLLLLAIVTFLQAGGWQRWLWLPVIILGSAGLALTFSRSAWLGAAAGALFLAGLVGLNKKWRQDYGRSLLLVGLAGGIVAGGVLWSQRELLLVRADVRSTSFEQRSVDEREALAAMGRGFVQMAPLTGIGGNNFAVAVLPQTAVLPGVGAQPDHHLPRLLTAELGLIGGMLWVGLMVLPLVTAVNLFRSGRLTLWAAGVTAALLAFGVIDLFDYYAWGWVPGQLLRWLAWGMWVTAVSAAATQTPPAQSSR